MEAGGKYCASRCGKGHTASALSRDRTRGSEDLGSFLWMRHALSTHNLCIGMNVGTYGSRAKSIASLARSALAQFLPRCGERQHLSD